MRITGIILLVVGLLAVTLTAVFAAGGRGRGQGNGQCRQQGSCVVAAAQAVTLDGTVSDLVQPEPGTQAGPVQFTLRNDKTATLVRLGPPHALKALELTLANGDAVKLTGWQITQDKETWLVVRELTLKDKTYTLRGEDGRPVWRGQGGCGQGGCGQGGGQGYGRCRGRCNGACQQ